MKTKVILRDWHNAICKVAIVPDEYIPILDSIDDATHGRTVLSPDEDSDRLAEWLYAILDFSKVQFTEENHRYLEDRPKMYDWYFYF